MPTDGDGLRLATTEDFVEDLTLTVQELLTRGLTLSGIRRIVTKAARQGPFE